MTTNTDTSMLSKLAGYLAQLSPVPAFPDYTGPYEVGTVDVEIPVDDLNSPSPAPANAEGISTIQFRVFYPAVPESGGQHIPWLANPQRSHVSAAVEIAGLRPTVTNILSFLPRHLHYTTIPAHKNADTAEPPANNSSRWPTMIFSHGLKSGRNSYSYIAGSLASHGVVVFCPEHRDGSSFLSFIRLRSFVSSQSRRTVPYKTVSSELNLEGYESRENQQRVRLWELGLVHDAILAMDQGKAFSNFNLTTPTLKQFVGRLHVHEPGSIIFAGHSFGAASIHQFLKCTYYADHPSVVAMEHPLFTPAKDSSIRKQVTEKNVTILLDMWCRPLFAPKSAPLLSLPLPVYAATPSAPGGAALLAVESQDFYNWTPQLQVKARLLSPDPGARIVTPEQYEKPGGAKLPYPNFFYVVNSAHLGQSDFGILFPWLTKKVLNAEHPDRTLRLNIRAMLQVLRANNIPVSSTCADDLVENVLVEKGGSTGTNSDGTDDDTAILEQSESGAVVDHWRWINTVGLGDAAGESGVKPTAEQVEEGKPQMEEALDQCEDAVVQPVRQTMSAAAA